MNDCNCPTHVATPQQAAPSEPIQRPQFRTKENSEGATIQIALPGVTKDDLSLTLEEGALRVQATRKTSVPEGWKTIRESEIPARYKLDIRLTSRLDGTKTTANLEAGVLTLQVPTREEAKPRQIQVN